MWDILIYPCRPITKRLSVGHNIGVLGETSLFNLPREVLEQLQSTATGSHHAQIFYRLEIDSQHYYSQKYGRVKKRNSCSGQLRMGQIQYFLPAAFAVIKRLCISNTSSYVAFWSSIGCSETLNSLWGYSYWIHRCYTCQRHQGKVLYMDVCTDCKYVARFPCTLLHDIHSCWIYACAGFVCT